MASAPRPDHRHDGSSPSGPWPGDGHSRPKATGQATAVPRRPAVLAFAAAMVGAAAAAFSSLTALTASALAPDIDHSAGAAQVVTPADAIPQFEPLTAGNSSTMFTLLLPGTPPACTMDSANFGFRVQTYMVPASVNPNTLTFDTDGPIGPDSYQPLFDQFTAPFVSGQTANADPPGGPGPVINLPTFNFEVFPPGFITPGDYNIGVACTLGQPGPNQLDKFWNVKLSFVADPSVGTSEVTFTVVGGATDPTSTSTSSIGGSSTTSSIGGSSTSSSIGGSSTSSSIGGSSTTSKTEGGDSGGSGGTLGGILPRTGTSQLMALFGALALIGIGRVVVLASRRPATRNGPGR